MIVAQGGAFGGWSLYAHEGKPAYCYNLFGLQQFKIYGDEPLPAGEHQVRMEFAYDGGGLGQGRDGDALRRRREGGRGQGRSDGADGLLRRRDAATSAATRRRPSATTTGAQTNAFTGRVRWVQLDLGDDAEDPDHQISRRGAIPDRDGAAVAKR